jgi:hypothetical protein
VQAEGFALAEQAPIEPRSLDENKEEPAAHGVAAEDAPSPVARLETLLVAQEASPGTADQFDAAHVFRGEVISSREPAVEIAAIAPLGPTSAASETGLQAEADTPNDEILLTSKGAGADEAAGTPPAQRLDGERVPPDALQRVEPPEPEPAAREVAASISPGGENASTAPHADANVVNLTVADAEAIPSPPDTSRQPSSIPDDVAAERRPSGDEARDGAESLGPGGGARLPHSSHEGDGVPFELLPAARQVDVPAHDDVTLVTANTVRTEEASREPSPEAEHVTLEQPPEIDGAFVDRVPDAQRGPSKERRRPRPDIEEMARPAVVSAAAIEDDTYRLWNRAVAQHCLLDDDGTDALYLTVTPAILAAAFSGARPGHLRPEDAEAAFVRSVSAVYHDRVLGHRERLRVLRRCGPDGLPDCIAFLAASVLAAYEMRSDEEMAGTAYYKRLSDLLRCELAGGHPRGFDPVEFEALWRFLEAWLRTEKGRQLVLPGAEVGLRRYVALPLMHVPLRRVDIERLPEFFWWAGYEPRARILRSVLDQDLAGWCSGAGRFTDPGMAALADERRVAVLAQVAHELESWDGEQRDSRGCRGARVEILLDFVKRRPELSYLPRRPIVFPAVFDDGVRRLEAAEDGWYEPLPLRSEDGPMLLDGFEWEVAAEGLRFALLRPPARAIALPESPEYSWFVSHKALRVGVRAAALCTEALAGPAAEYLSAISGQRCTPLIHPGLPAGWRLFVNVRPRHRIRLPPDELSALEVEGVVDLIPRDGLRLGARWAWLAGAPPRLTVAGLEPGEGATVNGLAVRVAEDGSLATDEHFTRAGTYIVEAAGMRRRIEIVEPQLPRSSAGPTPSMAALALPRGAWTILGSVPGEIAVPAARSHAGAVARCAFRAVWAVEVGAGGARVLSLCTEPPPPARPARFTHGSLGGRALRWACELYDASIRRPIPKAADGQPCGPAVRSKWVEYGQAAREIKRQFRRGRR